MPLFAPGSSPPRARRHDPPSSHRAADQAEADGTIGRQAQRALWIVRRWPGRSSLTLATIGPLDRYQLARRLPELERAGLVRRVQAGAGDIRWWPVTDAGGEELIVHEALM